VDISLPSLIAIPNSFGAPPSPLQPGQIVDALVLAVLDNGVVRLKVPDGIIDVRTAVQLVAGAKVRLAVNSTSAGLQLTVLTDANGGAIAAPATLVGRGQPGPDIPPRAEAQAQAAEIALSDAPQTPSAMTAPDPASPTRPADAAEALAAAVRTAAARQGGLAPLMADLEQAVNAGTTLPAPVAAAAARVLDLRAPLEENLVGADVKQALARSGLFLEARLAQMPAAPAPVDLKAALVVFRQVVKLWLDAGVPDASAPAASAPIASARPAVPPAAPPPPYRGAPPTAQPIASPTLPPEAPPRAVAEHLLGQTEAALARHTLLQVASLPEAVPAGGSQATHPGSHWAFEIPFATGQGTAVAQFEISRDGGHAAAEGRTVWRARFSLDVEPMGPVHALVAVLGEQAAVTLWAEREASAARLREGAGLLADALRGAALEPGNIQMRVGAPSAPPSAAGRFLDRAS